MDMKRFFLYAIVIAALALAGCGGNGGGGPVVTPTPDPCPDGQVGTPPNCAPDPTSVAALFEAAEDGKNAAAAAQKSAEDAVEAATAASGKLDVFKVKGDSLVAKMNAKEVLDSQTAAKTAVTTAEQAVTDLEQADKDADKHNNTTLDSAIAGALKVAEDAVKAAKAERDSDALTDAVEAVTGTDKNKIKTATDTQTTVSTAIKEALAASSDANVPSGDAARVNHLNIVGDVDTSGTVAHARAGKLLTLDTDDHQGMTFEEIAGSSNVVDKQVASGENQTTKVKAMSADDMTFTFGTGQTLPGTSTKEAPTTSGTQVGTLATGGSLTTTYKGVPGMLFCQGSDCVVTAVADDPDTSANESTSQRKFTGSWYFTPETASATITFLKNATGTYAAETTFVRYGHWLSGTTAAPNINTFAHTNGAGTTATQSNDLTNGDYNLITVNTATNAILADTSATYTGNAAGMSFRQNVGSDGDVVAGSVHSGAFTADVTMTATFGASPTLGGTINNFQSTNMYAVDPNWTVELQVRAFNGGSIVGDQDNYGRAIATGQDGVWSATAYGSAATTNVDNSGVPTGNDTGANNVSVRPTGIFGGFNAHFSNGAAAGAYAVRK